MTTSILATQYHTVATPALKKILGTTNPMALPRLKKVILNVGIGKFATDTKKRDIVVSNLSRISGQKPVITKAKKSISNFKVRKGLGIGVVVTLRGRRMYDFLEKLIHVTLPRVRDFHGLPLTAFDQSGNYTISLREHNVFPEIGSDEMDFLHGLQITLCTTAESPTDAEALLRQLGFPLEERKG